jgi:4'-phosphopantetheinyl transferase
MAADRTVTWLARGEPHLPATDSWLSERERVRAAAMPYTKRRREFLVARWTLKQAAVRAMGWPTTDDVLARVEARHAVTGAPQLYADGQPAGLDVSLTDRAGWAVCVLGAPGTALGCDLELVEHRTAAFIRDYLTAAEQAIVATAERVAGDDGRDLAANLMWSAKESALKVLQTGLRRDTRSVEVTLDGFDAPGRTWAALAVRTREGETYAGWWRRSGAFVLTTCARVAQPEPTSLEVPPALDAAEPMHTWLEGPLSR